MALVALLITLPCWAQDDLVVNGGFEDGTEGWHFVLGGYGQVGADWGKAGARAEIAAEPVHAGEAALVLDATALDHEVDLHSDPMQVVPGHGYRLTSFVRELAGTANYKVTIDWRNAEGEHLAYENDWRGNDHPEAFKRHGGIFVSPEDVGEAVIILGTGTGGKFAFDDISLSHLGPAEPLDARERVDGDGTVAVEGPSSVPAGSHATWHLTYTVGNSGLPAGGGIRIARSNVDFSWSEFQSSEPESAGYVTARSKEGVELDVRGGEEVTVLVGWPALAPGDTIEITLGDTADGGPGLRAQGRPETGIAWVVSSDANADV